MQPGFSRIGGGKTMNWSKKGLIFCTDGKMDWSKTHAQAPVAEYNPANNTIRIYYATRDAEGRSLPGCIVVDADDPCRIQDVSLKPLLDLGERGAFDDCGVMPSCLINHGDKKYLYYTGWNVRNTITYHLSIGVAVSEDEGKTFRKLFSGPVLERNRLEPHLVGAPFILVEYGIWKIWYLSGTEWKIVQGKPEPRYHIKYAESADGINWKREGLVAVDYKDENEAGIARVSVLKHQEKYLMWYSFRNFTDYRTDPANSYSMGFAESADGKHWVRKDELNGLTKSADGWDSVMACYPYVINVKNKIYMFYNGNGFGQSGIGYAECK
jgi:hypothetical protein